MPVRVTITEGTRADCKEASALIDGLYAKVLFADRGYDSNEIILFIGEYQIEKRIDILVKEGK
ncbi:hypothetical protein LEPN108286_07850 [Legionella pneumophila subsp. pneumophila]